MAWPSNWGSPYGLPVETCLLGTVTGATMAILKRLGGHDHIFEYPVIGDLTDDDPSHDVRRWGKRTVKLELSMINGG